MSIFDTISHAASIAPDIAKAVSDAESLLTDVSLIQNDPAVKSAILQSPQLGSALSRVSAEIRTLENDVNKIKQDLRF